MEANFPRSSNPQADCTQVSDDIFVYQSIKVYQTTSPATTDGITETQEARVPNGEAQPDRA